MACLEEKLTSLIKYQSSLAPARAYASQDCHFFTGEATGSVDVTVESLRTDVAPGLVHASTRGPDAVLRVVALNRVETGLSVVAAQHVKQVLQ